MHVTFDPYNFAESADH